MIRVIPFCVLFLFSTLTESIPSLSNQPQTHENYFIRDQPIKQGPTLGEIQKKIQEQRPIIKERIDNKPIQLNSVTENIRNNNPLRQVQYSEQLPLKNAPERVWSESSAQSGVTTSTEIEKQRVIAAAEAVLPTKAAEIARAVAQANAANAAILTAEKAQIAGAITKSNSKQTNIYTPPKQYQYANLPSNGHNVAQLLQSNPKLKDVISSVKSTKRYLVLHPDGRVEHVDNLEPIVQKHPNHILVNAGIIRDHISRMDQPTYPVGTSIPNPSPVLIPATPNAVPAVPTAAASTAMATAATSFSPTFKALLKPHISHEPASTASVTSITTGTVIETPTALSSAKTSTAPGVTIPKTAASLLSPIAFMAPVVPVPTTPSTSSATTSVVHPSYIPKPKPISNTHVNTFFNTLQKHSDHNLVNAGILKDHIPRIDKLTYPVGTSMPNPSPISIPATPNAALAVATAAPSTAMATAVTSAGPTFKTLLKPHISHKLAKMASAISTTATTETPTTSLPTKTSTTPAVKVAVTAAPSLLSTALVAPVIPVCTTPSTLSAPIHPTVTSACSVSDNPVSSTIDGITNNLHALTTAATTSVDHPSQILRPIPIINTKVDTLTSTVPPIITPKPSDTHTTSFSITSSLPATPCQTTSVVDVPAKPILPKSETISPSASCTSAKPSNATSKADSSVSNVNSDSSTSTSSNGTTPQTVAHSANTDKPCSVTVDQSSLQASSFDTTGASGEALFEDSDDINDCELDHFQLVGEPVLWFEETDIDWDKILGDEPYSIVYFIHIPPQHILEKDTETTVYPNGPIVDDIIETEKDRDCDE